MPEQKSINSSGKRITLLKGGDILEIHIVSEKNWWLVGLCPLGLVAWFMFGVSVLLQFVNGKALGSDFFHLVFWLMIWSFGIFFTAYVWFWNMFGKEIIRFSRNTLTIENDILGFNQTTKFQIYKISNPRFSKFIRPRWPRLFDVKQLGISGGAVAFTYQGKIYKLGILLDWKDAQFLVDVLRLHVLKRQQRIG